MSDPKLSIKDIPVANDRLYEEVARITKQNKTDVKEMVEFIGKYIAGVIEKGDMEGVMVPYFGKFRPKHKQLKAMKKAQMQKANGMDVVFKAIQGKIVVIKQDNNETTGTDRGQAGSTE